MNAQTKFTLSNIYDTPWGPTNHGSFAVVNLNVDDVITVTLYPEKAPTEQITLAGYGASISIDPFGLQRMQISAAVYPATIAMVQSLIAGLSVDAAAALSGLSGSLGTSIVNPSFSDLTSALAGTTDIGGTTYLPGFPTQYARLTQADLSVSVRGTAIGAASVRAVIQINDVTDGVIVPIIGVIADETGTSNKLYVPSIPLDLGTLLYTYAGGAVVGTSWRFELVITNLVGTPTCDAHASVFVALL